MWSALPVFGVLFAGFGFVYLLWPNTEVIARYGFAALGIALLILVFTMLRATRTTASGTWQRTLWYGMAVGMICWMAASVLEFFEFEMSQPAFGSRADVLWVTGYLPMFWGLFQKFREARALKEGTRWLVILMAVCYCVVFYAYLFPRIADPDRDLPGKTLDVIYLTFNFTLLQMIVTIQRDLVQMRDRLASAFREMSVAVTIMLLTDLLLGYFTDQSSATYQVLDLPYLVIYFLFYLAAHQGLAKEPMERRL